MCSTASHHASEHLPIQFSEDAVSRVLGLAFSLSCCILVLNIPVVSPLVLEKTIRAFLRSPISMVRSKFGSH